MALLLVNNVHCITKYRDFIFTFCICLIFANRNAQFLCWSKVTFGFKKCILRIIGKLFPAGDPCFYFLLIFYSFLEDAQSLKMVIIVIV